MDGSLSGLQSGTAPVIATRAEPAGNQLIAKLARDARTMEDAFALRYESYYSHGYLDETIDKSFSDEYDSLDTSRTIVIYKAGNAVASVRLCLYQEAGGLGIPALKIFSDVLPAAIREGMGKSHYGRASEVCRLVTKPGLERNAELVFCLFRMAKYLTKYFNSEILFCAVRNNHVGMYRRIGFRQICEARDYVPKLKFQTALVMGIEREYEPVQQNIVFLRDVAKYDDTYNSLFSGQPTPVFNLDATHKIAPPTQPVRESWAA